MHSSVNCLQQNMQVLTGQKLEVIKLRIAEEIEGPYRKVHSLFCDGTIILCCVSIYK